MEIKRNHSGSKNSETMLYKKYKAHLNDSSVSIVYNFDLLDTYTKCENILSISKEN